MSFETEVYGLEEKRDITVDQKNIMREMDSKKQNKKIYREEKSKFI